MQHPKGDAGADAGAADAEALASVQLMDLDDHLLVAICSFLGFLDLLRLQQARVLLHARHSHAS
jgi:hypothetical protein